MNDYNHLSREEKIELLNKISSKEITLAELKNQIRQVESKEYDQTEGLNYRDRKTGQIKTYQEIKDYCGQFPPNKYLLIETIKALDQPPTHIIIIPFNQNF